MITDKNKSVLGGKNADFFVRKMSLRNNTSLSQLVHELKDKGTNYDIEWAILKHAAPYRGGGRACNLCISESYEIIRDKEGVINRHCEGIISCMHVRNRTFRSFENMRRTDL